VPVLLWRHVSCDFWREFLTTILNRLEHGEGGAPKLRRKCCHSRAGRAVPCPYGPIRRLRDVVAVGERNYDEEASEQISSEKARQKCGLDYRFRRGIKSAGRKRDR